MIEWPFYFPAKTMSPEWDVLQAIITKLRSFSVRPKLCHVKGHQDDKVPYHLLELPAQLNVDADELAGNFNYSPRQQPTEVPLITGNSVQVHLPQGTITSKLKQVIRKTASAISMQRHICQSTSGLLLNSTWSTGKPIVSASANIIPRNDSSRD